ncbi:hypothetical protein HOY80DRAFT_639822 [Tuber brumale]|nr:hypothetical protein HOY80DRAFT_639822 [Tuber brumale]
MPFHIPQLPHLLQLLLHLLDLGQLHLLGHRLGARNTNQPPHIPNIFHNGAQQPPPHDRFLPASHRPLPFTPAHLPATPAIPAPINH